MSVLSQKEANKLIALEKEYRGGTSIYFPDIRKAA